ncbi:MAG: hypothetical protein KAU20_06690, partial [Nanoarchaeota archaeon]|nr:hypothetical protein [Nanoarchaeota archaeon]
MRKIIYKGIRIMLFCMLISLFLAVPISAERNLVKTLFDKFTKENTEIMCKSHEASFSFRRELELYEVNTTDAYGNSIIEHISLINLYIENKENVSLENVVFKEKIPPGITTELGDVSFLDNTPLIEEGLVAVWKFPKIAPGEKKVVKYGVKKKLSEDILNEFKEPDVKSAPVE